MITEDYVSFETAKLLKEKGFDENCAALYDLRNGAFNEKQTGYVFNNYRWDNFITAPTLQMAMKWLREQNRIISIVHGYITNKYRIIITQSNELDTTNLGNTLYCSDDYDYFSYEEACKAAIKYCLTNLI